MEFDCEGPGVVRFVEQRGCFSSKQIKSLPIVQSLLAAVNRILVVGLSGFTWLFSSAGETGTAGAGSFTAFVDGVKTYSASELEQLYEPLRMAVFPSPKGATGHQWIAPSLDRQPLV